MKLLHNPKKSPHMDLEQILLADIEKRGLEITTEELGSRILGLESEAVIKRVIHTTADLDYAGNLIFSLHAATEGLKALRFGTPIIMDINTGRVGTNKTVLHKTGNEAYCFMAGEDAARAIREAGITRATTSMDKTVALSSQGKDYIFVIDNAPTALIRIKKPVDQGKLHPEPITAVSVGSVSVAQTKELILGLGIPYIVAKGRKGGSNVTATVCSVLLYRLYI